MSRHAGPHEPQLGIGRDGRGEARRHGLDELHLAGSRAAIRAVGPGSTPDHRVDRRLAAPVIGIRLHGDVIVGIKSVTR